MLKNESTETPGVKHYPVCGRRYEATDGEVLIPRMVDEREDVIMYTGSDFEGLRQVTLQQWLVDVPMSFGTGDFSDE